MQTFLLSDTIYGLNPLRIKERRLYLGSLEFVTSFTKIQFFIMTREQFEKSDAQNWSQIPQDPIFNF